MRDLEPIYEHLVWLARNKLVITPDIMSTRLGMDTPGLLWGLRKLRDDRRITLEERIIQHGAKAIVYYRAKIIETGRSTKWNEHARDKDKHEPAPLSLSESLLVRRITAEKDREEHVRTWLGRELHPRAKRPKPETFFIDRETQRALQGFS